MPVEHPALVQLRNWDVGAWLALRARQRGAHTALVWEPVDGDQRRWSYSRLFSDVLDCAGGLLARGVGKGDRVLLHTENHPSTIVAYFAAAWIGAESVLSSARATTDELRHVIDVAAPAGVVTQASLLPALEPALDGTMWVSTETPTNPVAAAPPPPGIRPDPLRPLSIQFSSGTTARPKPVRWTHANALWGARTAAAHAAIGPDDVTLVHAPISHTMGMSWQVLATLWSGGTVVLQPKFSASRFWTVSAAEGCTWTYMVPFGIEALRAQEPPPAHRYRWWGGWVDSTRVADRYGIPLVGSWGMTEAITQVIHGEPLGGTDGAIGRPVPEYQVDVVDETGRTVREGETGSLRISGTPGLSLFLEYLGDQVTTERSFDEAGRFITGDRVTVLEDGRIRFADRERDVIKVGGENVSGAEIERVAAGVPGVHSVAAVPGQDRMLGEVPHLFVVLRAGADPEVTLSAIEQACTTRLSPFKVPRGLHVVPSLPRGNLGKVLKNELKDRLRDAR